jgi:hypothetical protein
MWGILRLHLSVRCKTQHDELAILAVEPRICECTAIATAELPDSIGKGRFGVLCRLNRIEEVHVVQITIIVLVVADRHVDPSKGLPVASLFGATRDSAWLVAQDRVLVSHDEHPNGRPTHSDAAEWLYLLACPMVLHGAQSYGVQAPAVEQQVGTQ